MVAGSFFKIKTAGTKWPLTAGYLPFAIGKKQLL
jgi:hypothetical protein